MRGLRRLYSILIPLVVASPLSAGTVTPPTVRCVPNTSVSLSCQTGYTTIGAAVTAAISGDIIIVGPGTYAESVSIPSTLSGLTLLGAEAGVDPRKGTRTNAAAESIIDGSSQANSTLIVQANNVVIDGFTVQGGINGNATGIDLKGSGSGFFPANSARVFNNIVQNNSVGLALNSEQFGPVTDVVIHQNLFRNNNAGIPGQSGDGLFTSACQNLTISDNTFTGNFRLSMGINNSSGVTISDNVADQETRFVIFTGTTNASVVNNTGTRLVATVPAGFTDPSQPSYVLVGPGNSSITISNNSFTGGEAASQIRGIDVTTAYGTTSPNLLINISGNTIRSMPQHGIVAEAGMLLLSVIANNRVSESGTDGIFIDINNATNRITGNFSTANGSKDFLDSTTGPGTASTADVWIKNIGLNRTPAGIARPKIQTDLNADSRGDIVLQNSGGGDVAWLMNGNTITNGVTVGSAPSSLKVVASGDFNGDGLADLILQDQNTGDVTEWQLNGGVVVAGVIIGSPGTSVKVVGAADVNGDGMSDIILQNQGTGDVTAWEMNGTTILAQPLLGSPGSSFKVVATGDFNGDGTDDILLQNSGTGQVIEWQLKDGTIINQGTLNSPAAVWHVISSGDFNGDGFSDVLLQNATTGDVAVWTVNGLTVTGGRIVGSPGTDWIVRGSSDFNGDGKWDILLQSQSTGNVAEWQMNGFVVSSGAVIGSPSTAYTVVGEH